MERVTLRTELCGRQLSQRLLGGAGGPQGEVEGPSHPPIPAAPLGHALGYSPVVVPSPMMAPAVLPPFRVRLAGGQVDGLCTLSVSRFRYLPPSAVVEAGVRERLLPFVEERGLAQGSPFTCSAPLCDAEAEWGQLQVRGSC